jgi:hypothetical protein
MDLTRRERQMRAHSLAIKHGFRGEIPESRSFPFHVGDYECKCGVKYAIYTNQAHYDLGKRFSTYVEDLLNNAHQQNGTHPDFIDLPMEAEFPPS